VLLFLTAINAPCQSKKERKKYKIKSTTEWETTLTDGKSATYKCLYEEFDRDGRSVLKTEFAPDGKVIFKSTIKYDSYGNKTAETEFDAGKNKNLMWTYRYNALKDKTEETEYNAAGEIRKKTVFTYDADGNRISETETDPAGNLLKKVVFTYNSKNLKTEKKTTPASIQKEKTKKWDYVYH
jgi:YD repeat-containing protein